MRQLKIYKRLAINSFSTDRMWFPWTNELLAKTVPQIWIYCF